MTTTEPTEIVAPAAVPAVAGVASPAAASDSFIRPAAGVAQIREAFEAYQRLCDNLLVGDDFQEIGGKSFKKKSAYRKLAVAFNVTVELVERVYERNAAGRIVRAEVIARAIAPNGRSMDGIGAADLFEKCCNPETCRNRSKYHSHCKADCDGARHFGNPQHDLPATAATRATNRACSDLFGMGEVSAEEITDRHAEPEPPRKSLKERVADLGDDGPDAFRAFLDANGFSRVPKEWNEDEARAVEKWLRSVESGEVTIGENPDGDTATADNGEGQADASADPTPAPENGSTAVSPEIDPTEAEIAAVKAMKPDDVRAELESLGLDAVGNADTIRKRLVLHRLRSKVAAVENRGTDDEPIEVATEPES